MGWDEMGWNVDINIDLFGLSLSRISAGVFCIIQSKVVSTLLVEARYLNQARCLKHLLAHQLTNYSTTE